MGSWRSVAAVAAGVVAFCAAAGPSALGNFTPQGDVVINETQGTNTTCDRSLLERPFSKLGDKRYYVQAPQGSFETALDGWQLIDGAKVSSYSGRSRAHEKDDAKALSLPPGASVITPAMCIDLDYPFFRFLTRAVGNGDDAELVVEVIYPGAQNPSFEEMSKFDGKQGSTAGSGWRLGNDVQLKPEAFDDEPGARKVAFRITALGPADGASVGWLLDEINVDPRNRI